MNASQRRPSFDRNAQPKVSSHANASPQEHNCRLCWYLDDEDRRGCDACDGTGRVRGRRAPVDALAHAVWAGPGRFIFPNRYGIPKARRDYSLKPDAEFLSYYFAECAIRFQAKARELGYVPREQRAA